jgi:hypothetical protein
MREVVKMMARSFRVKPTSFGRMRLACWRASFSAAEGAVCMRDLIKVSSDIVNMIDPVADSSGTTLRRASHVMCRRLDTNF